MITCQDYHAQSKEVNKSMQTFIDQFGLKSLFCTVLIYARNKKV